MKNRIVEQPRTFTPDFKENGEMNPHAFAKLSEEVEEIQRKAALEEPNYEL